jgi:signal transduction histidine kinase
VTTVAAIPGVIPLHRGPTDVHALLRESLEALEQQAKALDVSVHLSVEANVPTTVTLDPDKIGWAVAALAGNALRYVSHGSHSKPGGSIIVHARMDAHGDLAIDVQDDGPGISADRLRRLFSAGPDRVRTGLALLMVRDVAAAHGGQVDVESCTDPFRSGTTVRITLPVA